MSPVFEQFGNRAQRILVLAQEEARQLGHAHVGPEHLLLGLLAGTEGTAAVVLKTAGATLSRTRSAVGDAVGPIRHPPVATPPLTPHSTKVLELALRLALQHGHPTVETADVLLGIIEQRDGLVMEVLTSVGVDPADVRREVLATLVAPTAHPAEPL